jgi:hypothetical protein
VLLHSPLPGIELLDTCTVFRILSSFR